MITGHTFATDDAAIFAANYLNQSARIRNQMHTVAFRDGRYVYIRDEYASRHLSDLLSALIEEDSD
jgi:hypothetical protein